jgi:hypothetical protein
MAPVLQVRRAILCACEQGAIRGLDTYTRNYLLQGGAQLAMPPLATLIAQQRELTDEQREAGVQPSRDASAPPRRPAAHAPRDRIAHRHAPATRRHKMRPAGHSRRDARRRGARGDTRVSRAADSALTAACRVRCAREPQPNASVPSCRRALAAHWRA